MPSIVKFFGPPGTGKTTKLTEIVQNEVKAGTPLERIGFLSFSRAAREVIRDRMGATEREMRWFRTIHGAATVNLGIGGSIFGWQHYRDFFEKTKLRLSPDDADEEFKVGDYNVALRALNLSQTTLRPLRDIVRELPDHPNLQKDRLDAFIATWAKYKRDAHLYDFMDMLVDYDRDGTPLPVDVMILDEAQDLSALQWRCFEKMAANAQRIYMAGDDDQAIYTFIGASEYGFLDHPADEEHVLKQSYRCPKLVGAKAEKLIGRVEHRKEKEISWRDEPGEVGRISLDPTFAPWKKWTEQFDSVMILTRHRRGAQDFSSKLQLVGVGHSLNGETINTWPEAKIMHGLYALTNGQSITSLSAIKIAEEFGRPSKEYRKLDKRERVSKMEGVSIDWLVNFHPDRRKRTRYLALQRLIRKEGYEALAADPKLMISTMHAAKGKEADLVIIDPDCTNVVKKNMQTATEIRLAYVAMTRAKKSLMIMLPRTETFINHFFGG